MADRIWRGDAVAVAQIVTMTPGVIVSGREYGLKINGKRVAVTASGTTAAGLVALLVAAVNGSTIPEWREVIASGTDALVLTSRAAGVPFIVYPEVGGFLVNGVIQVTVRNSPTGGTWEFNAGVYGIADVTYNSSAASMQTQMDTLFGAGNTLVTKEVSGTDLIYRVEFTGTFAAAAVPAVTVSYADLTGGDAALVITTVQAATVGTDEVQTITLIGASGGTFRVAFRGVYTAAVAYNVSTAGMQTALRAISTINGANVTVAGTAGVSYAVTFTGELAHEDVPLLEVDDTSLTAPKPSVAETTPGALGINDVQLLRIRPLAGNDEAFTIAYSGTVTAGTFKINLDGNTDGTALAYNCTAQTIADEISRLIQVHRLSTYAHQCVCELGHHLYTPNAVGFIQFNLYGDLGYTHSGLTGSVYDGLTVDNTGLTGGTYSLASAATESGGGGAFPSSGAGGISLTYAGQTANVNVNDDAATVQVALEALSSIGAGNIEVTDYRFNGASSGNSFGLWRLEFIGALAGTPLAYVTVSLTGSAAATWSAQNTKEWVGVATGANEVQTLSISASPSAGTFTLDYSGQVTGALPYNATAAQVQTALRALTAIGATGVVCSGGALPGTPVVITFGGPLSYTDVPLIVARSYDMNNTVAVTTPGVTGQNEIQRLSLTGQEVWAGTLTLTWSGQTTSALAYTAAATVVEAALVALSNIASGDVICSGGPWPESPINVEWAGAQAETNVAAITSTSSLKNGVAVGEDFDPLVSTLTQRASGPNHWNEGVNWYNPADPDEALCPQRQDTVYITEGSTDILYGLLQRVAFTVDAATDLLASVGPHDFNEGQIVEVWSTTTLPAGLSAATAYYVMDLDRVTGKFKLTTSVGGAAVNITDAGTGTHHVGVRLNRWYQSGKYTGNIGLGWTNDSEYKEYRPLYVNIGFNAAGTNAITIGQGDGASSGRTNIDTGTEPLALFEVLNSNGSRETGIPAINWLGDNAVTVIQVLGGDVGVAMRATETAAFGSLVIRGGSVGLGTVEFATLDQTGGTLSPVSAMTLSGVAKVRL